MAKWNIEDGLEYYNADTRPQTQMEMVREFVTLSGQKPDPVLYGNLIKEELREWSEEYYLFEGYFNPEEIGYQAEDELKELADLLYVAYGYANARGWDLEEAFRRVHQNNVGRMYQPDGTIKRREDGKILKNKDYPKVDLKDLVKGKTE